MAQENEPHTHQPYLQPDSSPSPHLEGGRPLEEEAQGNAAFTPAHGPAGAQPQAAGYVPASAQSQAAGYVPVPEQPRAAGPLPGATQPQATGYAPAAGQPQATGYAPGTYYATPPAQPAAAPLPMASTSEQAYGGTRRPETMPPFVEAPAYDAAPYAHDVNGAGLYEAPAQPSFDYTYISSPARIAIYDTLKTAPRVIQIQGGPTHEYIEHIASLTFRHAKEAGGTIPYTVIREVSENFIHAQFQEVIVSILDSGNTIRFADQGPGIKHKELAQEPGFSSAIEPMKRYIRGVGSGLPIVKDYLDTSHGYIQIEDNINQGSVVTISLVPPHEAQEGAPLDVPELTGNEIAVLRALSPDKVLGVTDMNRITGMANASIYTAFSKMEEAGLVKKVNKKRSLTPEGRRVALSL